VLQGRHKTVAQKRELAIREVQVSLSRLIDLGAACISLKNALHKSAKMWYSFTRRIIMRTTIEMESSTASRLQKLAEARCISVEELLASHVAGLSGENSNGTVSGEERLRAFEEWVEGFSQITPPLSDEAVGRASIYRDR
jgi:hypothetical protein